MMICKQCRANVVIDGNGYCEKCLKEVEEEIISALMSLVPKQLMMVKQGMNLGEEGDKIFDKLIQASINESGGCAL